MLGLTATGFVFLLAFTLGNFWGNHSEACSATLNEVTMYARAVSIVETIPADQGGTQIMAAPEKYRRDREGNRRCGPGGCQQIARVESPN